MKLLKAWIMQFVKATVKLRISQESVWINNSMYFTSAVVQGNKGFGLNDSDCNLWVSEAECPQNILKWLTYMIHLGGYSKTLKPGYMFYGSCWSTGNNRNIKKKSSVMAFKVCLFFSLKIYLCKSDELEKLIKFRFAHFVTDIVLWKNENFKDDKIWILWLWDCMVHFLMKINFLDDSHCKWVS